MFKSENVLAEFATTRALYCVWIRADETPGAPLVSVWIDSKMRAFEDFGEAAEWTLTADAGPAQGAPESRPVRLTAQDVKHSV
jgi:hypothetical protein